MKHRSLIILFVLLHLLSCGVEGDGEDSNIVARIGAAPVIDGVIEEGEWEDATRVRVDSTKTVYFKHDRENLYIALDGDGGNLYFNREGRIWVLHASWSLGWAEYSEAAHNLWRREVDYAWELHRLQEEPETAVRDSISAHLSEKGWVASIVPLGNGQESEFAVSMDWLGVQVEGVSDRPVRIPKLFISSFQNIHPDERKRLGLKAENLRLRWPALAVPNDSLNRGYAPEVMEMDLSEWTHIYLES